jgi:PPOX class probable FMN-dependent enzyme
VSTIDSIDQLRALYPAPKEKALKKQLDALDAHCLSFIRLSPFVTLASVGASGAMDASPRGGAPGFVRALDAHTLLIPDAPGNNRLDTLENIIANGKLGLLFFIPGFDETLRINGNARLSRLGAHLQLFASEKNPPRLVIELRVNEAYLHCAKAFMRSRLWQASAQVPRSALPSMGQMISDQTGMAAPDETQEQVLARYTADL